MGIPHKLVQEQAARTPRQRNGFNFSRGDWRPSPPPPDRPVKTKADFTDAELAKIVADELARQPKELRCWLR